HQVQVMYIQRHSQKTKAKLISTINRSEGIHNNASKRHRDRLNSEMEDLAAALPLPPAAITKLDKLSVLRLSVGYLRARAFFQPGMLQPKSARVKPSTLRTHCHGGEMKHFNGLQMLEGRNLSVSMSGVLLVIMADGTVFYVSQNIQQYLGFNQTDVILESVFDLIHADDRAAFQARLCWEETERCDSDLSVYSDGTFSRPPTDYVADGAQSTAVTEQQRNFSCRFRCLLDNNSGFMMLQVQGKLKRLGSGGVGSLGAGGGGPALFALAVPQNPMLPTELRLWNIIFTTKHKLDFSTLSLDSKARLVMGYTSVEFRRRKAVNFQHLGDMLYLKANNLILMKNGESEPVVFRLLSKQGKWLWVKASARIIYRKGKADFIIATQFLLRDEEGEYYLKNRNPECKFDVTGEAI
uniref:Aryl hydrocarbon receptor n=1 Tax=Petromyzon marinus TaxID=7757 RepID=S4RMW8_PETMA